jgi:peptidoglycan/LPS O-acetylase OafA/YrhL
MDGQKTMARMINALYYAAAATTAIAGILHLVLAPNILEFNLNTGIFFIVAGIAQLFWVVPLIRKWGKPWYLAGIVGTLILIVLFAITRMPDNPITGRAGPIMPMALVIEVMQVAFIGLSIAIIIYESKIRKHLSGKTTSGRA